jgi:hypothetical protein
VDEYKKCILGKCVGISVEPIARPGCVCHAYVKSDVSVDVIHIEKGFAIVHNTNHGKVYSKVFC